MKTVKTWYVEVEDRERVISEDLANRILEFQNAKIKGSLFTLLVRGELVGQFRGNDMRLRSKTVTDRTEDSQGFMEHREKAEKWTKDAMATLDPAELEDIRRQVSSRHSETAKLLRDGTFVDDMVKIEIRKRFGCPFTPDGHPARQHSKLGAEVVMQNIEAYRYWKPEFKEGICSWRCTDPAAYRQAVTA